MRIVIIGAGIGGVASAVALTASGHEVEVYERADRLRTDGNGVLLYPNGTGILGEFGVRTDDLGVPMNALDLLARDGTRLVELRFDKMARKLRHPIVVVRRGEIVERLAARLPQGVVRFGVGCVGVERAGGSGGRPRAVLTDGEYAEADLVIGADGHRSVVRTATLGDSSARYTGTANWHGITKLPGAFARGDRVHSLYGEEGICVMHPIGDGEVYWAFELPWSDGEKLPPGPLGTSGPVADSIVGNLRARFADWHVSALPQLLDTLTDDDVSLFPHVIHQLPDLRDAGAVTLVGDAVHVVPPRVGMGANQALEDAWVLGRTLSRPGAPQELARAFEQWRLPRLQRMYRTAEFKGRKTIHTPLALLRATRKWFPRSSQHQTKLVQMSNYLNGDAPAAGPLLAAPTATAATR
jgi:FAD-dependent urate hydroxylase